MTVLSQRFGHEENFSRYLLESGQFEALLRRAGFRVAGVGDLELPVRYGHQGCEGRLDIHQPTTAGVVIGEMQYGVSDSNHRNRFAGYAKSVSNPAAIFWVAEGFRAKDLEAVSASKVPVVCVQAKLIDGEVRLNAVGGARLSAQSASKRTAQLVKRAWQWVRLADIEGMIDAWLQDKIVREVNADTDAKAFAEAVSTEQLTQELLEGKGYYFRKAWAGTEPASKKRALAINTCPEKEEIFAHTHERVCSVVAKLDQKVARRISWEVEQERKNREWNAEYVNATLERQIEMHNQRWVIAC